MPSVKVVISNNIKLLNPPTPLRLKITGALVMKNPVYEDRLKRKLPTWGMESRIKMYSDDAGGNVLIPRGFFSEFDRLCKEAGYTVEYTDQRVKGTLAYFGWNDDIKLRDYQEKAMNDLKYNGVLVAPAGSGKTTIGMRYISEGKRAALWLVHTQELMDQAAKTAERAFPHVGRVGKIGSGICNYGDHKLIIAMVQTLHERPEIVEKLNEYIGTVVFDECHHFPATMFLELGSQLKAQWILGLTATPDRKDKLEKLMYVGLGPLQHEVARGSMYHDGTLIKPEINFIYTDFVSKQDIDEELENVDAGGEDLDYTGLIKELISDEARARLIAKTITTNVTKGPAIILSQSVRYSFKVAELVEQYLEEDGMRGVRICVIHGGISQYVWRSVRKSVALQMIKTGEAVDHKKDEKGYKVKIQMYTDEEFRRWQVPPERRRAVMELARARKVDLLFCTNLAREGLDLPHLCVGHMITPKKGDQQSRKDGAAVEQEIGRIMRADPGNPAKKAYWFDYVDYAVGVFKEHYYSRRKVYKRLGFTVPAKPREEKDDIEDFLGKMVW